MKINDIVKITNPGESYTTHPSLEYYKQLPINSFGIIPEKHSKGRIVEDVTALVRRLEEGRVFKIIIKRRAFYMGEHGIQPVTDNNSK